LIPVPCLKTISVAFAALLLSASAHSRDLKQPAADYFGAYTGCALLITRDRHGESRFEFGPEQCALPLSPCSTFKIPNALIGLQLGVVSGPEHLKQWDGTKHQRETNNRDHDLASAIGESVVWYFRSLARDVGPVRMQEWLDRLNYGNRDISAGTDRFWLGASLEIDAYGQLGILKALKHQTLPFKPEYQRQVTEMLVQDAPLAGRLHAKTGSCLGEANVKPDHGWFIGWVDWDKSTDSNPVTTFFVLNITGDSAWGSQARPIALQLLKELQP
jgi:beta-lactamase class D